jgi:mannose-6-phosphate isomerase-like protein (cupin superfamily)
VTDPVLRREDREPFETKDGSTVVELAHPAFSVAKNQSLAEAAVPAAGETVSHLHPRAEEIYAFTAGRGRMALGEEVFEVAAGDTVVIPPGTPHKLWADADGPLVLLCASSPPYSHEDTELLE